MTDGSLKTIYQTPPNVIAYMISLLPEDIISVLEPTPGEKNIVKALIAKGYLVTFPEDYFLMDHHSWFDAVVMNPPFSSKSMDVTNAPVKYKNSGMKAGYMILEECMERSDTIIALVPWFTISDSDVRLRKLGNFGMKSITVLPRKTFNYARIQTCVIELVRGWDKPTEFKIFDLIKHHLI